MAGFSLWRAGSFPETARVGGKDAPVRADFRTALKILALHGDPDAPRRLKTKLALEWFYPEPPGNAGEALAALDAHLAGGREECKDPVAEALRARRAESAGPPEMCFEHDAAEIWASFLQQYGIDLLEPPPMHWRKFLALLGCLGPDTPLARRVQARTADLKGLRGRDLARAMKAKEDARIPERLSAEEARERREFLESLM